MPTRNINLTDHYDVFVNEQVASGQYQNASEVMRAGLRLLEREKQEDAEKLILLRRAAVEGFAAIDQDDAVALKGEHAITTHIAKIGRRVARQSKRPRNG